MIKTEDLKKIVKLVLLSGYIKNSKPLNLMLISVAGNGKTEIISSFKSPRSLFMSDLSYMGLLKSLKENPKIKHLILPDFIKITMKKRATSDNLVSILNAFTDEGVGKINLFNFEADFKNRNMGVITATTKASYGQHKKIWENIGFISRMLVCSYDYSEQTINEIFKFINQEQYFKEEKEKLSSKDKEICSSEKLNKQLNKLAGKNFRCLKQLQALAKCNALLRNSNKVEQQDIEEIKRLSQYINLNYKKI